MMQRNYSMCEGLLFKFVCFYFVLFCTSSIIAQGVRVNVKFRSQSNNRSNESPRQQSGLNQVYAIPTHRQKGRLYSRTGLFLEILENGEVQGTINTSSKYTILEMQVYNKTLKRLLGVHSGLFLALVMSGKRKAKFVGVLERNNNSLFEDHQELNGYCTYRPISFPRHLNNTGYLAIKENGKLRRVDRTLPGMQASQFLFMNI